MSKFAYKTLTAAEVTQIQTSARTPAQPDLAAELNSLERVHARHVALLDSGDGEDHAEAVRVLELGITDLRKRATATPPTGL